MRFNGSALYIFVAELMLMGFISLTITIITTPISKVCVKSSAYNKWTPCDIKSRPSDATPTGADYPPVDGRRRLLATAAGDSYCAEVLCQIISSPFTTLSVLTNYIFYSFYVLCISCLQIIFMYVAVTPV